MHMLSFFFLLFNISKKFPKCCIFFPNSSQGPFPKIVGKGPDYTACKYFRQMLANTDSSVIIQLIFTFYKILFLTKLGKMIKLANLSSTHKAPCTIHICEAQVCKMSQFTKQEKWQQLTGFSRMHKILPFGALSIKMNQKKSSVHPP